MGRNVLESEGGPSRLSILVDQFRDVLVWLLIVAAFISGVVLDEWIDSGVILAIVVLNALLGFAQEARAEDALARLKELAAPDAVIEGFSVQRMARIGDAHELIVGIADDEVFGPVLLFGAGGTAVEVLRDKAIGLPPLNMVLARDMIGRTRISQLLHGYRSRPAADLDKIPGW